MTIKNITTRKRQAGVALVLFACASTALGAVEDSEVAACASKTNTVERLSCFDDLAAKHNLAPSTTTESKAGAGQWVSSTDTDPMTDKSIHTAVLLAQSGKGRFGDPIGLVVRCSNNKTEMFISWQSYLGRDTISTTYRVGKSAAKTARWSLSTNNKAAFFPGSPIPVLKEIIEADSFVANVTPYNESPVTAVFNTTGAGAALEDVRKGCGW